ncbi:farnesol dehydrogenase-like [Atheta coriaria]|uniref:farnesol dehydrogenase-like n=1 Tax=Dalotia coriaria TaxID=877792 RepID=UPI0031F39478
MERYVGKVAIVTGASAGIGEATVDSLTKAGMKVVGLARRVERVQALADKLSKEGAKGKLYAVKCDMRVEDDIVKAFEWTTKNVGNVQVLINNAGVIGANSNLAEGITEEWRKVIETNVLGLCIATREATKIMKANKIEGHIIHINSIAGQSHLFFPTIGVYGASKHAVTNLTEILRQEMVAQKTNIKVTSISPGAVKTEIIDMAILTEEMKKLFADMPFLDSQDIADAVLYVLGVPHRVQINELTIRPLNSSH